MGSVDEEMIKASLARINAGEEIRCQFIIREEIRCQFIILARKDEPTSDYAKR